MTTPGFSPTHVVPQHGMPAWEEPDPARPTMPLDPLLPVRLLERRGDWGRVLCSNGWSAWVDGRALVAVPKDPPRADAPHTAAADPRPLLDRAEQALARYRAAMEELADGDLDGESFRRRTQGLRLGVVVDGEDVWMYDSVGRRWVYGDGVRLSTYATDRAPRAAGDPPPETAEGLDRDRSGNPGGSQDRDRGRDRAGTEEQGLRQDLDHTVTRIVNRDGRP
ncbi:hypothetical protein [Streptomyces sp. AK04-3B]|uniref:hypothetical protein n=1 Tax=Streptomyces sp. AK04-3B TaxID=3028650 RepID=UPI0029ADCB24|nr:hypothetical protein [Streptomyces sp. AK04-3B]MDX3797427.1 hypothetical protein [Streptomyces sp. AK04-3B]